MDDERGLVPLLMDFLFRQRLEEDVRKGKERYPGVPLLF